MHRLYSLISFCHLVVASNLEQIIVELLPLLRAAATNQDLTILTYNEAPAYLHSHYCQAVFRQMVRQMSNCHSKSLKFVSSCAVYGAERLFSLVCLN